MLVNNKMLDLIHTIQDLAMQIKDFHYYYQESCKVFAVYKISDGEHTYDKQVYLDYDNAVEKLKEIVKDLEEMKEKWAV